VAATSNRRGKRLEEQERGERQDARGKSKEARGKRQKARFKRQEASGEWKKARNKRETRGKQEARCSRKGARDTSRKQEALHG
jgi:hypothetical protein